MIIPFDVFLIIMEYADAGVRTDFGFPPRRLGVRLAHPIFSLDLHPMVSSRGFSMNISYVTPSKYIRWFWTDLETEVDVYAIERDHQVILSRHRVYK
jgi:hypothetical protein